MTSSGEIPVSTNKSSPSSICPISLHSISAVPRNNLAVVYQSNPVNSRNYDEGCGHRCELSCLVSYLHDNRGSAVCPSCRSIVTAVCDVESDIFLRRRRHFVFDCANKDDAADEKSDDSAKGGTNEFLHSEKVGNDHDHAEENYENSTEDGRIITFRYGPISYFLWVSSKIGRASKGYAMERIGYVLNMNFQTGLKVRFMSCKLLFQIFVNDLKIFPNLCR